MSLFLVSCDKEKQPIVEPEPEEPEVVEPVPLELVGFEVVNPEYNPNEKLELSLSCMGDCEQMRVLVTVDNEGVVSYIKKNDEYVALTGNEFLPIEDGSSIYIDPLISDDYFVVVSLMSTSGVKQSIRKLVKIEPSLSVEGLDKDNVNYLPVGFVSDNNYPIRVYFYPANGGADWTALKWRLYPDTESIWMTDPKRKDASSSFWVMSACANAPGSVLASLSYGDKAIGDYRIRACYLADVKLKYGLIGRTVRSLSVTVHTPDIRPKLTVAVTITYALDLYHDDLLTDEQRANGEHKIERLSTEEKYYAVFDKMTYYADDEGRTEDKVLKDDMASPQYFDTTGLGSVMWDNVAGKYIITAYPELRPKIGRIIMSVVNEADPNGGDTKYGFDTEAISKIPPTYFADDFEFKLIPQNKEFVDFQIN